MIRYVYLLLFLLSSCSATHKIALSQIQDTQPQREYTVILSMDAFRWDLPAMCHTPTLDSLALVGSSAEIVPVFPSNTFPSHYSMATGLYPNNHGVVNNDFFDKTLGRKLSVFNRNDVITPNFWGGEPIWNTAERQGKRASVFMWVGGEYPINNRQASQWLPYSSRPNYYQRADWVIEALTRQEANIPDLVMWYFEQPDALMHNYGVGSKQVAARVEHIDSVLRYFFREVRRSPVFDRINFIVTADHGMADLSLDRQIDLTPMLDSTQVIRVVRGVPFGIEVREEYAQEAVRNLRKLDNIDVWQREELPQRFNYGSHPTRLTNIIVLPNSGWMVDYGSNRRPYQGKATHGFDPLDRDMHMVFYASGPSFRKNHRQPSFENHNIYLLLCRLLSISPAPNDCDVKKIEGMLNSN